MAAGFESSSTLGAPTLEADATISRRAAVLPSVE
jgi:hypothetical protein